MKKFLATILTLALVFSMSTVALAEERTDNGLGYDEEAVKINVVEDTTGQDVYHVVVVWEDLVFTYTEPNTGNWNVKTHVYDGPTTGGWDKTTATIKLENHSNVDIGYSAVLSENVLNGKTITVTDNNGAKIDSADAEQYTAEGGATTGSALAGDGYYTAPQATITVSITNDPPADLSVAETSGTIKLTISKYVPTP